MTRHTFKKAERLKSRKAIEYLFRHGRSHTVPPFRMIYMEADNCPFPVQMTVAVPRRSIRNAADRNLVKRRTREAYRLRKNDLYSSLDKKQKKYRVLFLYQSSGISAYSSIEKSIGILLQFLLRQ